MFGKRGRLVPTLTALVCAGALAATAACSSDASDDSASGGESSTSAAASTTSAAAGSSGAESELGDCAEPTVELLELEGHSDAEPLVRLPLPEGWERNTMMDSEMVRGMIGAPHLADHDAETVPVINVVFDEVTGFDGDAEEIVDAQVAGYDQIGGTVLDRSSTEVCGLYTERVEATAQVMGPEESELSALITVYQTEGASYAIVVTAQGPDPQNPEYQEAVDTVFEQIQILPSGGSL